MTNVHKCLALDAGLYVFNVNGENDIKKINDELSSGCITESNKHQIALYNCDKTECAQTSGYVISNGTPYKVNGRGGAEEYNTVNSCTIGDLLKGNKLCISGNTSVEANGNIYLMKNLAGNIFTGHLSLESNINGYITIKTESNIFAWDNISGGN